MIFFLQRIKSNWRIPVSITDYIVSNSIRNRELSLLFDLCIQSQPVIFYGEQTRIEQLDELSNERELDEDEMREYEYLNNRWKFCWHYPPHYEIEEFDSYE